MQEAPELVTLARDVDAIAIPDGETIRLREGVQALITQTLGGNYTIQLETGQKFRIAGADADALGKEATEAPDASEAGDPLSQEEAEKRAWEVLKQVHDPEIPINVVDLGLIYTLKVHRRGDGKFLAELRMSLTAPGCGMGDVMIADAVNALRTIPGVDTVDAKITFDPVWNPGMMSEAAKLQLGML